MQNRMTFIAILATVLVLGSAVAVIGTADSSDADSYVERYAYELRFEFTGQGATSENVSWDFGDGTPIVTGYKVTHKFKETGDYIVKLTAKNDVGESTKLYYIRIMGDPTVTFNTDGGSAISEKTVPLGKGGVPQLVERPTNDPTKLGYTFVDWYADDKCTVKWDFSKDVVGKHITLYAGWFKGVVTNEVPDTQTIKDTLASVKTLDYYIPTKSMDDPTKNLTLEKDLFPLKSNEKIQVHFYDANDESKKPLVTWVIDGLSEYNDQCMEEMELAVESKSAPFTEDQKKASESVGAKNGYYVNFKASGVLPYNMYVTVYVGDVYKTGDVLSLHLYEKGSMVYQDTEATVDSDGYVTTAIAHCSVYAFLSFADTSQGGIDTTTIIVIAVFGVLIAAIIGYRYFVGKKKA